MATFEIWKTVSYEASCFIEADSLEEAKQLLVDEAQDWDSINGQDADMPEIREGFNKFYNLTPKDDEYLD